MKKNKINMLSPEEMQKETSQQSRIDWDDWDSGTSGAIATDPYEACEGDNRFGTGCRWVDETGWFHYGQCQYDYNLPKFTLYCDEPPGGSGTDGQNAK